MNADGSIYRVPGAVTVTAVEEVDATDDDLPFEFERVPAEDVTAEELTDIMGQVAEAIRGEMRPWPVTVVPRSRRPSRRTSRPTPTRTRRPSRRSPPRPRRQPSRSRGPDRRHLGHWREHRRLRLDVEALGRWRGEFQACLSVRWQRLRLGPFWWLLKLKALAHPQLGRPDQDGASRCRVQDGASRCRVQDGASRCRNRESFNLQ